MSISSFLNICVLAGRSWFRNVWGFDRGNGRGKRTDGFRLSCIETKSIIFSFHISYGSKPSLGNIALHDEIQLWQKCFDCDGQQMWKSPSKGFRSKKQVNRLTKIVVFWQNIKISRQYIDAKSIWCRSHTTFQIFQ